MENEQLPAPPQPPSSSAGGTGTTPSSTGTGRPPAPQISVYSGIPDRQTVQVIQQALHRQPNTAAQYLQQMYAAQQQHLMLQTAALQQQHLTSAQLQSLAAVQQASLAANRQSGSSGTNGTQAAPAQQPTINLATSPAAAQLLNRAQSVAPGASGIAQQAVLLGNAASPALTASQAQMYLRAQMLIFTPTGPVSAVRPESPAPAPPPAPPPAPQPTAPQVHSLALRPAGPHLPALAMKPPGGPPRAGPPRVPLPETPGDHLKKAEGPEARTHPLARAAAPAAAHPLVAPAYAPLQPPQFLQQPPKPMQQQFVIQQQQQQQQLAPRGQPPPGPAAPQLQPLPPASPGPVPPPKAGAGPGVPHGAGADGAAPNGHPGCHGAPRKFQHASAVILQLQPAGATPPLSVPEGTRRDPLPAERSAESPPAAPPQPPALSPPAAPPGPEAPPGERPPAHGTRPHLRSPPVTCLSPSSVPMGLLTLIGCICAGLLAATAVALLMVAYRLGLLYRLLHKADPRSPRYGGELVAEVLKAHGVRFVFALAGGHISPILVASEKLGIRVVDTRHEATAVFAADAVSRLSGRIGVAAVTAGPGVTNAVTAIKNAQMAESPLLLIGGAAASLQKGRGALQDIDQLSLFKTLCKACISVRTVRDIVPALRKAISTAQSGTPGPVFVELPIDVLYPFHVVEKEVGGAKSARGIRGKLVQWYLQNYVHNLFAGAWVPRDVTPLPVKVPLATEDEVQRCAELVSRATKPLVLVGSQALLPPTPAEELREALEALGIPCYLGGAARGLLPPESPLLLRQNRRDALREADLVLLAGAVCDFRLSYGRLFGRQTVVVAVNRDRAQLLRNADVFWRPRLAVQGDAASFVVGLARRLRGYSCPADWLGGLREAEQRKEKANREKAATPTPQHLNPLDLLYRLDALLPPESLLVADGGDFVGTAAYIVRPRRPLSWLDPGAFGTLGVGGGFALGAKLCRPEAEVWVLYGDGSLGYSLIEFDTFVRHKTPIIALVGNDACWSQISREQVAMLGSNVACGLEYLDYHAVAEALGGKGFVVGRPESERLDAVLRAAQDACRQGHPVLVNALIGKTDFREGSISV